MILEDKDCSVVNIGTLDNLGEHSYFHSALNVEIKGKVFLGEILKASGMEISFQMMPPQMGMPFFHVHHENEELYVFLKGGGEFLADDRVIPVEEGSVVRVAPAVRRSWKNTSDVPMVVMVIQAREKALNKFYGSDGEMV